MDVFKTIIIPADQQKAGQEIMPGAFTTALSASGEPPATHYISSGYLPEELVEPLSELSGADVSDEEPFVAMERLGLKFVVAPIEIT